MRIYAHMVVRNEAHRYLESCLAWTARFVDKIHVFDDQSTDNSRDIAARYATISRNTSGVSFTGNEPLFRQTAWDTFVETMRPELGDWVLCIDADEFLVALTGNIRQQLITDIDVAYETNDRSILIRIPEVFAVVDGTPKIRIDGFWPTICAPRLCAYEPDGRFYRGSVPDYAAHPIHGWSGLVLLHYGYADYDDRIEKYLRYSDDNVHNQNHVRSILARPIFDDWAGPTPPVRRGPIPHNIDT